MSAPKACTLACWTGAQQYYGVEAEVVCYGKSAGVELPLGVICGPSRLLASPEARLPLWAGAKCGSGGALEQTAIMRSTNDFLRKVASLDTHARALDGGVPAAPSATADGAALGAPRADVGGFDFEASHARADRWAAQTNAALASEALPMRIVCEASVWSIHLLQPSRHHFILMLYLAQMGASLDWIGPQRLSIGPLRTSDEHLSALQRSLIAAAKAMVTDGWWAPPHEVGVHTETAIRMQLTREVTTEAASRLLEAMRCTLSPAHITH